MPESKSPTLFYYHDVAGCLADAVGHDGLEPPELEAALRGCAVALAWLRERHAARDLPLLHLPSRRDDLEGLAPVAKRLAADCPDHIVVLGTGGSSLGGQTLYALADIGLGPPSGGPKLLFLDNIDPDAFTELARVVDWRRAGLLVISKSGSTAETLTQFLTLLPDIRATLGDDTLRRHVVAIAEPDDNALRRLAARWSLPVLDHDPLVGGRFSVLSLVGMLPAMIARLSATSVRAGAAAVLDATLNAAQPADSAPAVGAAIAVALQRRRGISTTVLMPYLDRLAHFGLWYRQLWAESLGKGGNGTTPIRAMGTVDQHSQLQLYLDGPRDKVFTVLTGAVAGTGARVPADDAAEVGLDYLAGRRMGDLLDAEQRATADTLVRNGRPTRVMRIARLDESTLGALLMHFMIETIIAARLMGVDAFDQPAVEQGKILARAYLEAS